VNTPAHFQVLGICGSLRQKSYNMAALRTAGELMPPGLKLRITGIGELPMDGPAPAILNAVEHATGVRFDSVPLTPEAIMEALEGEAVKA